jgi:hypothetical protein
VDQCWSPSSGLNLFFNPFYNLSWLDSNFRREDFIEIATQCLDVTFRFDFLPVQAHNTTTFIEPSTHLILL